MSTQCRVKPSATRLYSVGRGAVSCWNAVTLAHRSLSSELMVLRQKRQRPGTGRLVYAPGAGPYMRCARLPLPARSVQPKPGPQPATALPAATHRTTIAAARRRAPALAHTALAQHQQPQLGAAVLPERLHRVQQAVLRGRRQVAQAAPLALALRLLRRRPRAAATRAA